MHVLYVYADSDSEWNCSQWRALTPSDGLNKTKTHSAKLLHIESFADYRSPAVQDIVGPADVIVVQRNVIGKPVWDAMDYWRGLRRTVVVDLDDDYPGLPWSNPAHAFWIENKANLAQPPIALLTEGLRHADALTSPSKTILRDWAHVVPGIWVPNFAMGAWFHGIGKIRRERDRSKVVLGWGGSVSHYDSWWMSGIREALQQLCAERKNVVVKICGNDKRLFDQLEVPAEQKIHQPGVAPQDWAKIVATFDIGLAPLDLTKGEQSYDHRRSWIKALEYLLVGVPWVASDGDPYQDVREYGRLVENSPENWLAALRESVDNLSQLEVNARKHQNVGWQLTIEASTTRLVETYERAMMLRHSIPALPDTFFVNWEEPKPESAFPEVPQRVRLPESLAEAIQQATYAAAKKWGAEHMVHIDGVPVSEPLRYDLMQHFNTVLAEHALRGAQ